MDIFKEIHFPLEHEKQFNAIVVMLKGHYNDSCRCKCETYGETAQHILCEYGALVKLMEVVCKALTIESGKFKRHSLNSGDCLCNKDYSLGDV